MFNFRKNPIGISISDYSIEVARVNKDREVESYGRKVLEGSPVENGKVKEKEELADILRTLVGEAKMKTDRVIICLPHSRLYFHLFHFDEKPGRKELREKTLKQAERTIPFETEEVYWDFKKVGNPEEGTNVLYAAAKKELLKDYMEVMEAAGLKVVKIEPERIALGRNLLSKKKQEKAIIDLGAKTINLSVFGKRNELRFVSDINFGGEELNQAIAEEKEVSLEKAEQLKREYGLDQSKEDNEVLPIIQKELQPPLEELRQAFEYYENNVGDEAEKIILTGGTALLPEIDEYLSLNLNKEVKLGDSLVNLSDGGSLTDEKAVHPLLFSSALGLSLGGLDKEDRDKTIDLLPKQLEEEKEVEEEKIGIISKAKNSKWLAVTVFALGIVLLGYVSYSYVFKSESEPQPAQQEPEQTATTSTSTPEQQEEEEPEEQEKTYTIVTIQETPTGWLRVRGGPGTTYEEIDRIEPQQKFKLLEKEDNWYKIEFTGENGWVSGEYIATSSTSTLINP